ncbi:unnamed protein product [Phaeothamnion confervicola]
MARAITQDAFDECVLENEEEFGLEREESILDAVRQFKAQGVDLSSIDTSGRQDLADARRETAELVKQLKGFGENEDEDVIAAALCALATRCAGTGDLVTAAKAAVAATLGVDAAARFLGPNASEAVQREALSCLRFVCQSHVTNRDHLDRHMARLVELLREHSPSGSDGSGGSNSSNSSSSGADVTATTADESRSGDADFTASALRLVRAGCIKSENNKTAFMRAGGATVLLGALCAHGNDAAAVRAACDTVRAITTGDDLRKDFSGAYDHVKSLVGKGAVANVLAAARQYYDDAETVTAVYLALKQLAANDESVKQIAELGGVDLVVGALRDFPADAAICRAAAAVARNAAGNDACRDALASGAGLDALLAAMAATPGDASLQEHGLATLAALALRAPHNARRVAAAGGFEAILAAMRAHPAASALQRQGCLAIRNAAARCTELRQPLLDAGAEPLLRAAGANRSCVDEAYAALRDLGCEAVLVARDESTGAAVAAVQGFGDRKANFEPVVERSAGLERRVNEAAVAPACAGFRL